MGPTKSTTNVWLDQVSKKLQIVDSPSLIKPWWYLKNHFQANSGDDDFVRYKFSSAIKCLNLKVEGLKLRDHTGAKGDLPDSPWARRD